jgi:hypothetical protein
MSSQMQTWVSKIDKGVLQRTALRARHTLVLTGLTFFALTSLLPGYVDAAQITTRKFTLSDSDGAATGVTYTFNSAALPTTTAVRSVQALVCTTASGACTTPTGFTGLNANLTSQPAGLGVATAWTDDSTAAALRITHATNVATSSGAVTIVWDTVTNPTADNTTYYLRTTTYSDAAYTTAIDSGVVAVSTANDITVSATVDETLTFCTGTSGITTSSCAAATGSSVALGTLTSGATGSGISQIGIATNAQSGCAVTVSGTTLTSSGNTITALAAQAVSTTGTEQFGINLRDNVTPNVGLEPDGAGTGAPTATYNTVDQYRFVNGDTIASKASADAFRRYHVAYIANIGSATEPGAYSTTLTYIGTATF